MKKGIQLVGIASACLILLAGCGSKATLKCSTKASGVDINLNVGFNGNKIEKMDLKYFMDLSSYSDTQIDMLKDTNFCSNVKSVMGELKDAFGNCNQSLEDKKLSLTADFDINKLSNTSLGKSQSPEDGKKDLEKVGYTCSIEK